MEAFEPLMMEWKGDAFVPANTHWQKIADRDLVIGSKYMVSEGEDRSQKTHNHLFAQIKDIWLQLEGDWHERFPRHELFRYWATIECGFCIDEVYEVASSPEAIRLQAALIQTHAKAKGYVKVIIDGGKVIVRHPESLKMRGTGYMPKAKFQEAKTAILEFTSNLIGVSPEDVEQNAGLAA